MTDLWPLEESYISEGAVIGFCKLVNSVALHAGVKMGTTSVSGVVSIVTGVGDGDSYGVALKAGVTDDLIPVCFHGIVKMVVGDTMTAGDMVMNDQSATYVLPIKAMTEDEILKWRGLNGTGTYIRLGQVLQNGAASGDEALVFIGRIA